MKSEANESIKKVVEEVLQSLGQGGRVPETRIMCSWEEIVGDQIASHSFPFHLRDGILSVAVYSAVWLNQMNFFRDEMARKVNCYLGDELVFSVRLFLHGKPGWLPRKRSRAPSAESLSQEDRQTIEEACGQVNDPELKSILRRVLSRQLSIIKSRR